MAESSILWTTDGIGDGSSSGYTMAQVIEWQRMLFAGLTGVDLSGVASDYLNELNVTGTATPVAVNTGGAIVYGFVYFNSASVNVTIPTPSTSTRIDRIVLRANWAAQTVRITRIAGTEGAGAPSLVQTAGTTWDMTLAQASITTGGAITVTDQREWLTMVGDNAIIFAKMQNILTDSLIGRDTAATGDPENITLGASLSMTGSGSLQRAALTGDVTAAANSNATTIANDAVTFAKMQNILTDSLIGRDTAATGDPENITLGASLSMTGAAVLQRAALTGDVTSAANSNAMAIAIDIIEYTDMRPFYSQPTVVYSPGANFDFTTVVTVDFDTANGAFDGPTLFSNNGGGEVTLAANGLLDISVSGYVGHAGGSTEAWCNVFIEWFTASSWVTVAKTGRVFHVPASNWNAFHTEGIVAASGAEKIRVRIERTSGIDTLRLSMDSALIIRAFA